jgi:hypothetical protein
MICGQFDCKAFYLGGWIRGHSSFLLIFAGFPIGFYGNVVLCQEPQGLPSDGFAITF